MRRAVLPWIVALAALAATPVRAAGQDPPDAATLEQARRHFAEGQRLFQAGELLPAASELKDAYRLTRNPLLLYNIGLIYDRLGDQALALHYYGRFIDDAEDNERTRAQLAEAGKRAAELRAAVGIEEPPATQPTEPPAPPPVRELQHDPIDQAPPGRPIDVTARAPRNLPWTVTLHYRAGGQDLFQPVRMRPRAGAPASPDVEELVARIPAAATRGGVVQYHVAARDPEGKLVGFSGKPQTPNIVYLDPAAPPHHFIEGAPEETAPAPPLPRAAEPPRAPDRPTRPLTYLKWGASAGAVAMLGTGIAFNLVARSYADTLESEAIKSTTESCGDGQPPPCRPYSQQRKDIDRRGKSFERWSTIGLVAGGVTALAAGALWFLDARATVVPVVGRDGAGAMATWSF